jgi:hypothetical protein
MLCRPIAYRLSYDGCSESRVSGSLGPKAIPRARVVGSGVRPVSRASCESMQPSRAGHGPSHCPHPGRRSLDHPLERGLQRRSGMVLPHQPEKITKSGLLRGARVVGSGVRPVSRALCESMQPSRAGHGPSHCPHPGRWFCRPFPRGCSSSPSSTGLASYRLYRRASIAPDRVSSIRTSTSLNGRNWHSKVAIPNLSSGFRSAKFDYALLTSLPRMVIKNA